MRWGNNIWFEVSNRENLGLDKMSRHNAFCWSPEIGVKFQNIVLPINYCNYVHPYQSLKKIIPHSVHMNQIIISNAEVN